MANSLPKQLRRGGTMQRGMPVVRFAAKVATQSATAVLATLIGGYVLTVLNPRTPDPARTATEPVAADARTLTREYVKSLRQGRELGREVGREDVAEVRPVVVLAPSKEIVVSKVAPPDALGRTVAPVARKENRLRAEATAAATPAVPAANAGPANVEPATGAPANLAPALGAPIVLTPATVAAIDGDDVAPDKPTQPNGAGPVFSAFSMLLGRAANATGDGINFVIDLPGRALGRGQESRNETRNPTRATSPPLRGREPGAAEAALPPLQYAGG